MLVSFVAFGLLFAWLLVHRYRVEVLEDRFEDEGLRRWPSPTGGPRAATSDPPGHPASGRSSRPDPGGRP